MRQLSCKDAGFQQCNAVMQGNNDDEVMRQAADHAQKAHGMERMTPEMDQSLRQRIKNV